MAVFQEYYIGDRIQDQLEAQLVFLGYLALAEIEKHADHPGHVAVGIAIDGHAAI